MESYQIKDNLAPFTFATFRLTVEAIDQLRLPPYKGSAIRGSFGHTFRRLVCVYKKGDCSDCELLRKCIYAYIFETPSPEDNQFLRNKNDKAPHPYIIRPPLDGRDGYDPEEEFTFELVLIGKAIDYVPYFALTFIHMGENGLGSGKGRFILKGIDSLGLNGNAVSIYNTGDQVLKDNSRTVTLSNLFENNPPPGECTLRFLTRLELKEKGRYPEIQFGRLFRRLLARVTTLAHLHCGIDCSGLDFKGLSHKADDVETVSSNLFWESSTRYSNRQKRRMPFSGLLGEATFKGDLSPFWPFLLLGERVHVGKKTTFGFGRYVILRS